MTIRQYRKKIDVAMRDGVASLGSGSELHYAKGFRNEWSIIAGDGNVVDVSYDPKHFDYICDDYVWNYPRKAEN